MVVMLLLLPLLLMMMIADTTTMAKDCVWYLLFLKHEFLSEPMLGLAYLPTIRRKKIPSSMHECALS